MIEEAVFTAIPVGRLDDGRLAATVFVTPRLATGEPPGAGVLRELAAFEAFAAWPKTVADARWVLEVDGIGAVEARPADDAIRPDPELWERLFGRTSVGEAGFQHFEDAVVHSFPVEEVTRAITELYQVVGRSSIAGFPAVTRGPLSGFVESLSLSPREGEGGGRRGVRNLIRRLHEQSPDPRGRYADIDAVPADRRGAFALAAATGFYDRSDDPWDEATATAPAPDAVAPEFHSFVARCADYPELLRHLGLAVDLWISDDAAIPEHGVLRVLDGANVGVLETLLAPAAARPMTLVHRTERVWAPASREEQPDVVDGSLVVDESERFLVDQIDPDGSALKVSSLLTTLRRTTADLAESAARNNSATSLTPDSSSLPALRSAGVLVARRNRAESLVRQVDRSAEHEQARASGDPAILDASDVTRGWRVDILDRDSGTEEWRSLHRRSGVYELVSPGSPAEPLAVQPAPDEAYLKAASTSSTGSAPADDQYLHETVAGWDGWSLAVRRPGKSVDETQPVDPVVDPAAGDGRVADTGFPLAARFVAQPGSLPRLRFGRSYRVRVRAVDLAGGSIPSDQLDEAHERDLEETYQRWEPVPSPAVVPLTEFTEGESLMRMVIRSTLDVPVDDYIALDRVRSLAGHRPDGRLGIVYREANERHVAAPIGSVQLAETHGLLDDALSGDPAAVAEQFAVAARESGSFLTLPGGRVVNHLSEPTALTGEKGQPLGQGEYIVHDTPLLELPYLPDPLSRGVAFRVLPGDGTSADTDARLVRWPGDPATWFDRRPVLVRVVDGTGEPTFDADARLLTVPLPKATLTTVRVSSFLDEADPDLLRVWNLLAAYVPSPVSSADRERVRRGEHWMTTPFGELTLVHAVEKPLEPPAIVLEPGVMRSRGETFTLLPGVVRNHAASTGRIDLDARWSDPVDDVLEPAPREHAAAAHVADFPLLPSETEARMWRVTGPAAGLFGPRHEVRHDLGDTKHRYVDYTPTATTRFREYFPPEITTRPELVTSVGEALTVDVPSSAPPEPPVVRYIVPTWEWQETALPVEGAPLAVRRVRTGGGLRVYLDRPWFSSGPDELLAVVLARQPWISWPVDVGRGIAGDIDVRAAADGWAASILERAGLGEGHAGPAAVLGDRLREAVSEAGTIGSGIRVRLGDGRVDVSPGTAVDGFGREIRVPSAVEPESDVERFLLDIDRATDDARRADAGLLAAVETEATSGLLETVLPSFASTSPEGRKFCSVWGADPVFAGESLPPGPFIHQFPLRTAVGTVALPDVAGDEVTAVGHQPQFDAERRLWFCDLQVDAGTAYTPLVRLRLARYQPHSIAGVHLSATVATDFIQLVPRREATVVVAPDARTAAVTLRGPVGVPRHAIALPDVASEVTASRVVEAWIERLPASATSDLEWEGASETVRLPVRMGLGALRRGRYDDVEWAGAIAVPERGAGDRLRLRIAEYELHDGDPQGRSPVRSAVGIRERRLVYGDDIEVP